MRIGWLRGAALLVALLLGGTAGVTASVLVAEQRTTGTRVDPLDIGADLVNLDCTDDTILSVGHGNASPTLRTAVVENPGAKYLETARSCPTYYVPVDWAIPRYLVYLGPFETPGDACARRMTVEHKGDNVIRLREDNQTYVKCPCELSAATFPVISPAMGVPDTLESMWIRQLQGMLVDLGRMPDEGKKSGLYDAETVAVVKRIQTAERVVADGVVDAELWATIRDRACRTYDY